VTATISVAMAGESHGWVLAVIPSPDRYVMAETLVVGSVRGNNGWDAEPGGTVEFKAWLWPFPGGAVRLGTHTEAVTAATPEALRDKLQKHAGKVGPWWTVSDGRCPEVLEHAGRQSRCETASAVAHDVHRHYADGVEWMPEEDFLGAPDGEGTA
jgi:hypothetical protein